MGAKKAQTHAKRARELAVKERRERKQAKKAEASLRRASGEDETVAASPDEEDHESAPE